MSSIFRTFLRRPHSIEAYMEELTSELEDRAGEADYESIDDYLDRPFCASEFFGVYSCWNETRKKLIDYYSGGYQLSR